MPSFRNVLHGILLAGCLAVPHSGFAQIGELEPNNPCGNAQDLTDPLLPAVIQGSLDAVGGVFDIDFFRLNAVAGTTLIAEHKGSSFGFGTLGDPLLGLFDSSCVLIAFNDDSGSLDSRLIFTVPSDGVFILAATSFADFDFNGEHSAEGTYLLSVNTLQIAESISGRLVNARDGTPVPGDAPPFALVELYRCDLSGCFEPVSAQNAGSDGSFLFDQAFDGSPLLVGSYLIRVNAMGFEFFELGPFELTLGTALDLGELALQPFTLIGSISGRLVDALDGTPLNGFSPPFAFAELQRCDDSGCFPVAGAPADELGRFLFDGGQFQLFPGTYRVVGFAEEYRPGASDEFPVAEFEDIDIGDLGLLPFPIQFGRVQPCEIPPGGGRCEFGIEIRNRGPGPFRGEAWTVIDFFRNAPPFSSSRFQVGRVGATNPMPEQVNLRVGEASQLRFQLDVPANVPDFSSICATLTVGRSPDPQFRNRGDRFLFCAETRSGQFEMLSEKEGRRHLRDLKRRNVR
jgi:hypothetical protein